MAIVTVVFLAVPVIVLLSKSENRKTVIISIAESHEIAPTISASGSISFKRQVNVSPEIIGRVTGLLVKPGDRVLEGQAIVMLDSSSSGALVQQSSASLSQARALVVSRQSMLIFAEGNVEKFTALARSGFIGHQQLEQYLRDRDVAKAELEGARQAVEVAGAVLYSAHTALSKTSIRSPVAGVVLSTPTRVGEVAVPSSINLPGSVLAVVADTDQAFAEVDVDEANIARIERGAETLIYVVGDEHSALKGRVVEVALTPKESAAGRNYRVRIELINKPRVVSGIGCRAQIAALRTLAHVAVPQEAVMVERTARGNSEVTVYYVYIARAGRAHRMEIETDRSDDRYVEVSHGLQPGDAVIVGPPKVLPWVRDGDEVITQPSAASEHG